MNDDFNRVAHTQAHVLDNRSRCLATADQVSHGNNTTEKQIIKYVVPSNFMRIGQVYRFQWMGQFTTGVTPQSHTWNVRFGPTTLTGATLTTITTTPAAGTTKGVSGEALVYIVGLGTGATTDGQLVLHFKVAELANANTFDTGTLGTAIDSTIPNILELTFNFGGTQANENMTVNIATLELVAP